MTGPAVRFRLDFTADCSVGPGKIGLLEAIRETGSLSQGARELGMSYRRAWLLVESLRQSFREPVTVASAGGKDGGGMQLTEFGAELIRSYRALERDIASLAERSMRPITAAVARRAMPEKRGSVRAKLA